MNLIQTMALQMMEMWVLIIAVFVCAGMVKGALGLGLPTMAMGLLTIVITPFQAASLLIIPSLITNIWQLLAEGQVWLLIQRFWSLLVGILVGSLFSVLPTLSQASGKTSETLLGTTLVVYALYALCVRQLPKLAPYEKWLSPVIGYLGGVLLVSTGVIIIPTVPYLQSLRLKRDDLVQSLGLVFTFSTICLAIYLQLHSTANIAINYRLVLIAVIAALWGMWFGQKLRYRIPEQRFRRFFFMGLILLGAYMIAHSGFIG